MLYEVITVLLRPLHVFRIHLDLLRVGDLHGQTEVLDHVLELLGHHAGNGLALEGLVLDLVVVVLGDDETGLKSYNFV